MKKKSLLLLFFAATFFAHAQNVAINNSATLPYASAVLDIKSSKKDLLMLRVALASIIDNTTIPLAATSLLIYNTLTAFTHPHICT